MAPVFAGSPIKRSSSKKPKNTMENNFTNKDRICLNCKYLHRRWNVIGILSLYAGGTDHYRCFRYVEKDMNPVTGKEEIVGNEMSCKYARSREGYCYQGQEWQASKEFLNKKENLFKVIVNTEDKNKRD